jgi:SHS2 domain-containing protein
VSFELREHTADVAVEAEAGSLGGVFAAVADGMAAAMADEIPGGGERFALEERAESREAALYDYLDRLVYERDVRGVLPVDNEATVREVRAEGDRSEGEGQERGEGDDEATEWVVEASARGLPLADVHARDLKAVTYSQMDLSQVEDGGGWHAYVVFDV